MAGYKVNTSRLRSNEDKLRQFNNQLRAEINNLKVTESNLNRSWDGDANDAFHTAFINDINQMENFYNLVNKYCNALHDIHVNYERVEAQNVSISKTRKYK